VLPGGLGNLVYRGRDSLLRGVARRRGIVVASLLADEAADEDTPAAIKVDMDGDGQAGASPPAAGAGDGQPDDGEPGDPAAAQPLGSAR
jgi:hypothetical protein